MSERPTHQLLIVTADADAVNGYLIPDNDYTENNVADFNGYEYSEFPKIIRDRIEDGTYPPVDFTHAIEI